MIRFGLLDMLLCPVTGEPVSTADQEFVHLLNREIKAGLLFNRLGIQIETEIDGGLVNDSRTWLIMIRSGVPDITPDQAIPIDHLEFFEPDQVPAEVRNHE